MKRNLFIFLFLGLLSFLSCDSCCMTESRDETLSVQNAVPGNLSDYEMVSTESSASFSATDCELYVPRPSSFSGPSRLQSTGKRNIQTLRNFTALLKGGKSISSNNSTIYTLEFFRFPSGFAENSHHLISLGKLII